MTTCLSARLLCASVWFLALIIGFPSITKGADAPCPTTEDEIATDRPDVTNSSQVVPFGSLQVENGVDWQNRDNSKLLDGTNSRVRFGIARCTEFLIDAPNYFQSISGPAPSGSTDVVTSFKRQLPVPFEFDLSATAGVAFPSGPVRVAGRGYEPYIQFPWSREIRDGWQVDGMLTLTWFPSDGPRSPAFESTFSVEREFEHTDVFVEYVGDYSHQAPSHILDVGGSWRFTKTQQIDFHLGFGLNEHAIKHYFGVGYSFRFDHLWGDHPGFAR